MKRIVLLIGLLVMSAIGYSQTTSQQPFRVVVVSPNFPNIYPRFNTLQATYTAIKDSASVSTGKYFIVNVTTNYNNITDWTGTYKDSLMNRDPYIKLVSFGQAVTDSIIGVTTSEFNLVAGILSLNSLTAGDGLTFSAHKYHLNVTNYLGNALYIDTDSLKLRLNNSLYFTPNLLSVKRPVYSGLQLLDSGLRVLPRRPLFLKGDTVYIQKSSIFGGDVDSLYIDWNTNHFENSYSSSPAVNIRLDSGMTSNANGIQLSLGSPRLSFLSNKKLTIPDAVAGDGLLWSSNTLKLNVARYTTTYITSTNQILFLDNDSLTFNYNPFQFKQSADGLMLVTSSYKGLISDPVDTIRVFIDDSELEFDMTSEGWIQINPLLAGNGLVKSGDKIHVVPNEFATADSDTLKIKTSYTIQFYGDSITTNVTSRGVLPYDSTGISVLGTGKIKRITYTYQLASGNDTVITQNNSITVTVGDKIRATWVNGSSEFRMQRWSVGTRSWSNQISVPFTNFANKPYRIIVELYAEAQ